MKKTLFFFIGGIIIGVSIMILIHIAGSQIKPPEPLLSAEKNSFSQVMPRLDRGGSVYAYLETSKSIAALSHRLEKIKELMLSGESLKQQDQEDIETIFDMFDRFIAHSGINEISGLGTSTIRLKNGLNRSKLFLHHYKGNNDGLFWNLFDDKPHNLDLLRILPKNTVLAIFNDFKPHELWQWIKKQIGSSDRFPLQKTTVIIDSALKMQGIRLDELLPQLQGEIGFILTLDPEKQVSLSLKQSTTQIDAFSAALVLTVRDRTLFNLIRQVVPVKTEKNSPVKETVGKNFKFSGYQVAVPENDYGFAPVVVQKEGLLIIATDIDVLEAIWKARNKKDRLLQTEYFKNLQLKMPVNGNGFRFVHSRLSETLMKIYKASLMPYGKTGELEYKLMDIFNPFPLNLQLFSVVKNTREGIIVTANHNMEPGQWMSLPMMTAIWGTLFTLGPDTVD